jgi:L-asparagine oxygenase
MATEILRLEITENEARSIRGLLDEMLADDRMRDQYFLLEQVHVLAQDLPRRVRETFYRFRRQQAEAVLHVVGSPVLLDGVPPTPGGYPETELGFELNDAQVLHGLYGSLLGEPFGFTSQRNGSIYNTIVPLPTHAHTPNSSSGSDHDFGFHVEDAFHPMRGDFIGLVCMRNEEEAPTTIACVDGIDTLKPDERDILFEPLFDVGHNPIHRTSGLVAEKRQPVFYGLSDRPYLTINFAALDLEKFTGLQRSALDNLLTYLEQNRTSVVLQSREYVYIDNYRCAHARDAFVPQYGDSARWLTRVVFTSDLRKSRSMRESTLSRAIAA